MFNRRRIIAETFEVTISENTVQRRVVEAKLYSIRLDKKQLVCSLTFELAS